MNMNTKSILTTAIAAAFALSGLAQAQDTSTTTQDDPIVTPAPEAQADTAPAQEPAADQATGDTAAEQPATDEAATEEPAAEPSTDEAATDQSAAEPETDEAASDEPAADEPAVEADQAATDAPEATEEPAAEPETAETDENMAEEPDVAAEEVTPDAENAPESAESETGTEEESATETEVATDSPAEEDEDVGVAEAEDHGGDHSTPHIENIDFSFDGPFGAYDVNQLQRGLQIYTEVCSACHGLKYVALRTLGDETGPNLPEDQVNEYAKQWDVFDAELDDTRAATPVDHFPASNLENAPDLSLMAKKRAAFHGPYGLGINQFLKGTGGPEYITAILTAYTGETKEQAGTTFYENTAFPGGWIAMAPPLSDELVEFADDHENDTHHLAEDVSAFLMWTAEPKLGARKQAGFAGVVFLTLLSVLLYLTNKRLWAPIKHRREQD